MEVLDPGHQYLLTSLDGGDPITLTFVKRDDPPEKYPGNVGHYPGTQIQEVLRALIDRAIYVNNQIPCNETEDAITHLRSALWLLEKRHLNRHEGNGSPLLENIENIPFCLKCGHIDCFCEEGGTL